MMDFILSKILQDLIKEHGLNISKLAELTGVNVQTIHNWSSGQKPKNIVQIKKVADFFDVSIEYLCFGESDNKKNDLNEYRDEINAGVFEVVLRRVKQ